LAADQIGRQFWQSLKMMFCPSVLDRDILIFDEPSFFETLTNPGDRASVPKWRATMQESNYRDCRPLRVRRNWPRRRSAQGRDKLASSHAQGRHPTSNGQPSLYRVPARPTRQFLHGRRV
jgi:hypothetical protein